MKKYFPQKVIIIMGVSGSGKSSISRLLADELSVSFIDADDYHPPANIEKMKQGIPLNDIDRAPWLDALHQIALNYIETGCVIACSALKEIYRKQLTQSIESNVLLIYLKGSYNLILTRMKMREGHFMNAKMLKSQFETLEEPENSIEIDITNSPEQILQEIKLVL